MSFQDHFLRMPTVCAVTQCVGMASSDEHLMLMESTYPYLIDMIRRQQVWYTKTMRELVPVTVKIGDDYGRYNPTP